MITILLLLILKHFIVDGPLQTPYQYSNKGKYGHMGGITHAFFHCIGTVICFGYVGADLSTSVMLGVVDMVIHYHIDYIKIKYGSMTYSKMSRDESGKQCLCIYDNKFFLWLLADQCCHFATYVLLLLLSIMQYG